MTFREHLGELRSRLVRIALFLLIGFFIGWDFRQEIFAFLSAPITEALADNGIYSYQAISITESIVVYLKSVFIADLVVMSPLIFYQLWAFVAPGLLDNERKFILPLTFFSVVFFLIGSAFAYQVIVPFITDWLVKLTLDDAVNMMVTMQNAYSFAFTFLLMFGLVFELPLVIYFLALFGTVGHQGLLKFWRYFAVIAFLLSAILTPPDPLSQVLMAIPLNALYGLGILIAYAVGRARERNPDPAGAGLGVTSMKLMGGALGLIGVAAALIILFIRTLPTPPLTTMAPAESTWIVGFNPAALTEVAPFSKVLDPKVEGSLGAELQASGIELEDLTEAILTGTDDGRRLLILRASGLAERKNAVVELLAARGFTGTAEAFEEHTLFVGDDKLAQAALAAAIEGDKQPTTAHETEARLLNRLPVSGPIWVWLPHTKNEGLLGEDLAADTIAAGAWLQLGDRHLFSADFGAVEKEGDALEARLDAARQQGASRATSELQVVARALKSLAALMKSDAKPAVKAELETIEATLEGLGKASEGTEVPALSRIGQVSSGWALKRNVDWVTLSTELDPKAVESLVLTMLLAEGGPTQAANTGKGNAEPQ